MADTDATLEEFSTGTTLAPSSSRSSPPLAAQGPIARVQKSEAQMATLLHHIQPLMQKSIVEDEDRIEKKVAQHTERKIQAAHQRLDAFEFRVLTRPAPTIDLTFFRQLWRVCGLMLVLY